MLDPNNPHVAKPNPAMPEDNMFDPWHWLAVYANGETISEYCEETGEHRNFALIVAHPPQTLALIPQYPERYGALQQVFVLIPDGAQPILFRIRQAYAILDPGAPVAQDPRATVIGYQQKIGRRTVKTLLALFDDGSCVLTDDRKRL
jgi:hypothetical protein